MSIPVEKVEELADIVQFASISVTKHDIAEELRALALAPHANRWFTDNVSDAARRLKQARWAEFSVDTPRGAGQRHVATLRILVDDSVSMERVKANLQRLLGEAVPAFQGRYRVVEVESK